MGTGSDRVRRGSPAPRSARAPASAALTAPRGRGSASNPTGRFERLQYVSDEETLEAERLAAEADPDSDPAGGARQIPTL